MQYLKWLVDNWSTLGQILGLIYGLFATVQWVKVKRQHDKLVKEIKKSPLAWQLFNTNALKKRKK